MIKTLLTSLMLTLGVTTVASADVGVAVNIGQPGFFGQIVLGNGYPVPQVIYPQPVIVQPPPVAVVQPPMYLRVPPGHMKRWSQYCGNYGACGRQVYFVQDNWYQNVYAPQYNHANGYGGYGGRDNHGRGEWHGEGRGGEWHGEGHGRGHGRD